MKRLFALLLLLVSTCVFAGGSSPGLYYGQVPTAAQWNSYFAAKLDYTPGSSNTLVYWDDSGNLQNAAVSGDCTAALNVFTCVSLSGSSFAAPASIGATTPNAGKFTALNTTVSSSNNGVVLRSATAPTIASGFGTTPSIVSSNGTATFKINVGTGGTATGGVVTMPTATTGWNCVVTPAAAPQAAAIMYSVATSTTSITITNYTLTTGSVLAWTASTIIAVNCVGF